jgi:LysM repeat protein
MDPRIRANLDSSSSEEPAFGPPPGKRPWHRSIEMPFVWLGAGLAVVLVLFLLFFPGKEADPVPEQRYPASLDLTQISERLDRLAASVEALRMQRMFAETGEGGQEGQAELVVAIRKLNADMSAQMAALSKKLDGFQGSSGAASAPAARAPVEKSAALSSPAVPPSTAVSQGDPALKTRKSPTPHPTEGGAVSEYRVQRGDTLYSIARNHGVSLDALLSANKMRQNDPIHPGQRLVIPR